MRGNNVKQPDRRPGSRSFSSGPCPKRPGWSSTALDAALVGRSHRSADGKARIEQAMALTRRLLALPEDYRIGIVPGSDTGAVEIALWNLLGARGVDVLAWESFGQDWVNDVVRELCVEPVRVLDAPYGRLPDLGSVDFDRDVVFLWNGTTSGVRVENGDWIPTDRTGLTICDATSAIFAMDMPWQKLDVITYSWQKVLGGEAAHGVLILSPRAVQRLESYRPARPLPKLFRLTKGDRLNEGIFSAGTINTPSMLCVEDYLDALVWAESLGGLPALLQRSAANLRVIADWVAATNWIDFLAEEPGQRSSTSICLKLVAPWFQELDDKAQRAVTKAMCAALEQADAAYDINGYRAAPPGLRIWGGATVEEDDLRALLPWLEWAYAQAAAEFGAVENV